MSQGDSQILVFVGVPKPHSSSLSFNRQTWTHLVGMGVFAYFHLFSQHLPIVFPHCCSWLVLSTSQHSLYGGLFFFAIEHCRIFSQHKHCSQDFSRFFPNFVPGCSTHFPSHVPIMFPSFPIDFPMDFPEFQHVFWHISASFPPSCSPEGIW